MEESHSLLLNEDALKNCAEGQRALFVYEWLRYLDRILPATQKSDLRSVQKALIAQLEGRLAAGPGPPTRILLARCIARIYSVGDVSSLSKTINDCNDRLKATKDDSPTALLAKLASLALLGELYESLGRLVGPSYEETFTAITKWLKSAESQGRAEMMLLLSKMVSGLGRACSHLHKDIYKTARANMIDRNLAVRVAAIECLRSLVQEYPPMYTTELEGIVTLCVKALDGSNYETRLAVASLLSKILISAHEPASATTRRGIMPIAPSSKSSASAPPAALPVEDCLQLLGGAFLRGGVGGFLKSSSSNTATAGGLKEVRVGIAMAYVEFIRAAGPAWLERQLGIVCKHLLSLASKAGGLAYTNSSSQLAEATLLRACISYVFRATLGAMLGESAQLIAAKHLGHLLAEHMNSFDYNTDSGVEGVLGTEAHCSGQACMVALLELGAIVKQIGTAVRPLFVEASGIMEPLFACLLHPVVGARVAAAWALRCLTLAVPGQLTPLIDRCLSRLEHMKSSSEAVSGYSLALAALIAGSKDCMLGIPHGKPKQVLTTAEELLRTAAQSSRLAVSKINAGWLLIGAVVSLGPAVVKEHMSRIAALWRASFPRSAKEAEAEKTRGDSFSWECALQSRAGALHVMQAVAEQRELLDDDTIKAMQLPIECGLVIMASVGPLVRGYGTKMRRLVAILRVRLYGLLALLSTRCYEQVFSSLLRELVADITLSDNTQSAQMTSLAAGYAGAGAVLLAPWHDNTDEFVLENSMHQASTGCVGSMDNDVVVLVSGDATSAGPPPAPQPPSVACLDGAIALYGKVFHLLPAKHRIQITEHFAETIKTSKPVARQRAIQLNVLCALVSAYRSGAGSSSSSSSSSSPSVPEALRVATSSLITAALPSDAPLVRAVAAEAAGRLAQAAGEPLFVASLAQTCFDRLQSSRDVLTRTGSALALGALHRHVGSLGSAQHLKTAVSIAMSLAQDGASPVVQSWSILALSQIAETGGGMFRGYVEPVLSMCVRALLSTPSGSPEVALATGKLLSALLTCVGPELGMGGPASGIEGVRASLLAACALQLSHGDVLVRAEGVAGLQQMHLFAPRHVHLANLVLDIASQLTSRHIALRRASVSCLRQLVQREAREVREHAQPLVPQGVVDDAKKLPLPRETGLEGALFGMLDVETDPVLRAHVQETIVSLVQATSGTLLSHWLQLCKEVLATAANDTPGAPTGSTNGGGGMTGIREEKEDDDEEGDDDVVLHVGGGRADDKGRLSSRWATRVFACQVVRRLMAVCDTERAHLDLALAKELQMSSGGRSDYLVLHLSDLVRMAFMGATSDSTQLRLAGLHCLQDVIARFAAVPEPEFPGHVLLEQFQAQVGAALRPAFAEETPSDVTAAACQVCSTWIGSKVARDLNDLRRVHQLLASSLSKLRHGSINTQLYSESAATLEKLAILKAWAEVYITAVEQREEEEEEEARRRKSSLRTPDDTYPSSTTSSSSLLSLVEPELSSLVLYWLAALRDSALLALPPQFAPQLPVDGGAFYKAQRAEACREYYRTAWPPLLLATAIWLRGHDFQLPSTSTEASLPSLLALCSVPSRLHLMSGIALDALCSRTTTADDATAHYALRALTSMMGSEAARLELMRDVRVPVEIVNVLHRLVLTRDALLTQQLCMECASAVMDAAAACRAVGTTTADAENGNIDSAQADRIKGLFACDEGGQTGELKPGMLSYAFMEFILAVIVRQMPQVNTAAMRSRSNAPLHTRRVGRMPPEGAALCTSAIQLLVQVPSLCSSPARLIVLPVSLHLITAFVRESARIDDASIVPELPPGHLTVTATAALQALRTLASSPPEDAAGGGPQGLRARWSILMRSALYTILSIPTANPACKFDECVLFLGASILSAASPREVAVGHKETVERLIRAAKVQLARSEPQVLSKCLQALTSLFSRRDLASVYARRLAPSVVALLKPFVLADDAEKAVKEISDDLVAVVADAVKALEALLPAVAEKNRISVISLLCQSLTRMLSASRADEWRALTPATRKLHEAALARLNALAPAYPSEFKQMLAGHPDVKRRLEAALLFQSTRAGHAAAAAKKAHAAMEAAKATANASSQPTIKLSMNFEAFAPATAE